MERDAGESDCGTSDLRVLLVCGTDFKYVKHPLNKRLRFKGCYLPCKREKHEVSKQGVHKKSLWLL